jgi:uncharacterized phage protein gp47/JayE
MAEFKLPSIFENQGVDEIHDRMMSNLPDDIDVSEGSHQWNLTMPHAYEKAFMASYMMPEAIKMIFPMFCEGYDDIMEYHAEARGMKRKQAECATGELLITGVAGTEIPAGSTFSTIAYNDQPSIDFYTTEIIEIGEDGTVTVPIKALLEGASGNVAANTIVLNSSYIDDITSVTNPEATSGGVEIESIEDLQERIKEHDVSMEYSYGGSPADYKRWALSVPGTGAAVIASPVDDTEPITIIVTDANGLPADDGLCQAVYDHIMQPNNPEQRLAPINDRIVVVAPATITANISATVELVPGHTIDQAKTAFIAALQVYMAEAADAGEIKYTKVGSILSSVAAINDYKNLLVNGDTGNIAITAEQVPSINSSSVTLTAGTV